MPESADESLFPRAERTLELMHRWGYAPTVETLADELMGGPVPTGQLRDAITASGSLVLIDGFVCARGKETLLGISRDRERTNRLVNGTAKAIAQEFANALIRACPFVDCVALSGSVASGGYVPSDDIDFDLFVHDGTKYLTYAVSLALGLAFSIRYANGGPLRKIICINVIWTRKQAFLFVRNDADLAFELLHCKPIFGAPYFQQVIRRNDWISRFFPQVAANLGPEVAHPNPSFTGRCLGWIVTHPRILGLVERAGRGLSFVVYQAVHWLRRHDLEAMDRLAFLQRAKYPYEVFQD